MWWQSMVPPFDCGRVGNFWVLSSFGVECIVGAQRRQPPSLPICICMCLYEWFFQAMILILGVFSCLSGLFQSFWM